MKVLACDGIHEDGLALLRDAGWEVVVSDPIKDPAELARALGDVDVLLVRSATRVPADVLDDAGRLRVIGRAGAGVDTIDVDAATRRGIAVPRPSTRSRCCLRWPATSRVPTRA